MKTELILIKTDAATKKRAKELARELGFGVSTILNAYLKQFIKDKAIYFTTTKQTQPESSKAIPSISYIKKLILPILKRYKVKRASIFGSVARGDTHPESDIDILAQLTDKTSLFKMVELKLDLEEALGRKVDLVEYKTIKPMLRDRILKDQIPIL